MEIQNATWILTADNNKRKKKTVQLAMIQNKKLKLGKNAQSKKLQVTT